MGFLLALVGEPNWAGLAEVVLDVRGCGWGGSERQPGKPRSSDNSSCSLPTTEGFLHRDLLLAEVSENFP